MSCNCHNHNHIGPPNNCNHINHVFDPKPPTFYGTWNHLYGHDITNKVSVSQPGIQSGLYRNCGPLNCSCCGNVTMLTGVETSAKIILTVHLSYSDSKLNTSIDIEPGKVYTIEYLNEGELCRATGLVSNIYKISQLDDTTNIYKINLDCSTQYAHNVVVIKSDQIRGVVKYIPYYGEDTSMESAWHLYGTTIAYKITDAVIIDAELDKNKNLVKGKIIQGTIINGTTTEGLCIGENPLKHNLIISSPCSTGGNVLEGYIMNGVVASGDIDGITEDDTGYIVHATIRGNLRDVLLVDTKISNARVANNVGSLITPVIENSRVFNATVSGDDMVTTGGVTIGNVTMNAVTTGGTAKGGIAIGQIEGKDFTIMGGTTVANNAALVTERGIVVGGTVIGGSKVGQVIYGATVKGGICTRGITTNGVTSVDITSENVQSFINNKGPIDPTLPMMVVGVSLPDIYKITAMNLNIPRGIDKVANDWYRDKLRYPLNRFGDTDLVLATNEIDYSRLFTNFGNMDIPND